MEFILNEKTTKEVRQAILDNPNKGLSEIAEMFNTTWHRIARIKSNVNKELGIDTGYKPTGRKRGRKPLHAFTKRKNQNIAKVKKVLNKWKFHKYGKPSYENVSQLADISKVTLTSYISNDPEIQNRLKELREQYKTFVDAPFVNVRGNNKDTARQKMVNHIAQSGLREGTILTLPSHTCKIELMLMEHVKGFDFMACEVEKSGYYNMLKTIVKNELPMHSYNGQVSDLIYSAKQDQYSHLILDYCGTIGRYANELKYALDNRIVKVGGTIAITLNKRGLINNTLLDVYKTVEDGESMHDEVIQGFCKQFEGQGYDFVEYFAYKDTACMSLAVLKRVA